MKCSGEYEILRGIFLLVSRFPLHFMLHGGNFDNFLDSVSPLFNWFRNVLQNQMKPGVIQTQPSLCRCSHASCATRSTQLIRNPNPTPLLCRRSLASCATWSTQLIRYPNPTFSLCAGVLAPRVRPNQRHQAEVRHVPGRSPGQLQGPAPRPGVHLRRDEPRGGRNAQRPGPGQPGGEAVLCLRLRKSGC